MSSLVRQAETAWNIFGANARENYVVRPSMPILYFGDSTEYFQSETRVVTVGLNPSYREFQNENGVYTVGLRFPFASDIVTPDTMTKRDEQFCEHYLQSLDQYFQAILDLVPEFPAITQRPEYGLQV